MMVIDPVDGVQMDASLVMGERMFTVMERVGGGGGG